MSARRAIRSLLSVAPTCAPRPVDRPRVALVLSGGGARGAYEAGVLRYLCEFFPKETGISPWFDVVSGTSVGALNACFMAATVDMLPRAATLLAERWTDLRVTEMLNVRPLEILRFARNLVGSSTPRSAPTTSHARTGERLGGILDTRN